MYHYFMETETGRQQLQALGHHEEAKEPDRPQEAPLPEARMRVRSSARAVRPPDLSRTEFETEIHMGK
eukprot:s910_g4.t1